MPHVSLDNAWVTHMAYLSLGYVFPGYLFVSLFDCISDRDSYLHFIQVLFMGSANAKWALSPKVPSRPCWSLVSRRIQVFLARACAQRYVSCISQKHQYLHI